jgi:hypothetical protein
VNEDGNINITDVNLLIAYVLGSNVTPFNAANANMNQDNEINVSDVTQLINKVLNSAD